MISVRFECPNCNMLCDAVRDNSDLLEWGINDDDDQEVRCGQCGKRYIVSKPKYYNSGYDYID